MRRPTKKYWEMNSSELAAATREFDQEFVADKARAMTPQERMEENRARRRGRGRPRVGKGTLKIHITLERGLLKEADNLARQKGLARSELIAAALATVLGRKAS